MKTDWEKIEAECKAVVENMIDTIMFYFHEYPEKRNDWAIAFESSFYDMVEKIKDEMNASDEEEGRN